jgi:very-short-patch-repair endonuclease
VGEALQPNCLAMRGGPSIRDRARTLRRQMTDAERMLRKSQLGQRFRRQFPIPPYIVDFACLEARLIVECDGGQHVGSGRDARRDAHLKRCRWPVLRFWNNEINGNLPGVIETIARALETANPHPDPPPPAGEGDSG